MLSAVFAGVLLGCMFGWSLDRVGASDSPGAAVTGATPTPTLPPLTTRGPDRAIDPPAGIADPPPDLPDQPVPEEPKDPEPTRGQAPTELKAALEKGVREAEAMGGVAEAAVILGAGEPVFAGNANKPMRMWSMSKPVTAIAAFRAAAKKDAPDGSAVLRGAMRDAITKSENCPQRRVVLGLQTLTGGPTKAREAYRAVLSDAGAEVDLDPSVVPPEASCGGYLQTHAGDVNIAAEAPQFGVSEWTVIDAARFASALGRGVYDDPGAKVLRMMRQPKAPSTELADAGEYSADRRWGAGLVFSNQNAAYKAGWGGTKQRKFMAGQIVTFDGRDGIVALAVMFHPSRQPERDDPGLANTADAIEAIMRAVKPELVG